MSVELEIKKIAFGGDGIGTVDGKTCFVEGVLAGEKVLVDIIDEKKNYSRARLVRILEPSAHRVPPPCPYVDRCGGCQYQHSDYEDELHSKGRQVSEMLGKATRIFVDCINGVVPSPKEFGYRNGITLHPSQPESKKPQRFCFIGRDNVSRVVIDNCLLADERLRPVFGQNFHLKGNADRLTFKLAEDGKIVSDARDLFFRVRVSGSDFLVNSKGFFQNNLGVADLLAQRISAWVEELKTEVFYDLFAGVGTFSFLSARKVPRIFCVEESPLGAAAIRMNRQEKQPEHMEVIEARAERAFPALWSAEKNRRAFVLLDPPRQGLQRKFVEFLASDAKPDALCYVSCDLARLARDLRMILAGGFYRIREVVPFDMFPKTKHIETAVLLTP
jgi:tRNA/tmRNA/rRNA uracil-C5-methylase (TrmA/RlmC/RlmD family)